MDGKITIKRNKPLQTIEDVLPLGLVIHDLEGNPWVYVGYRVTTVGSVRRTFRVAMPTDAGFPGWDYSAVLRATLINKFPNLEPHWPEGEQP